MSVNKFPVVFNISHSRIVDLLVGAVEQSSGYWCRITEESDVPPNTEKYADGDDLCCSYYKYFCGGWTQFTLFDPDTGKLSNLNYTLNLSNIRKGVRILAEKYPHHMAAWIQERDDAETADAFLQCCLFKEVIYG